MNQPGAPGQAAPDPGNAHPNQPGGGAPRPPTMYKPEAMRQMPFLSEEEKQKYERGLRQLWTIFENSPQGSKEQIDSRRKIMDFSAMLLGKLRQRRQSVGPPGQPDGANQQQQPQPQPAAQGQPAGNIQVPNVPAPAAGAGANPQGDRPGTAHAPAVPGANGSHPPPQYPESIMRHVNQMTYHPPPHYADKSPEMIQKWQTEMKTRYAKALMQMSSTGEQVKKIELHIKERADRGQPLNDAEKKGLEDRKAQFQKGWGEAHKFVDQFRKQQEALSKGAGLNAGTAPRPQAGQPGNVNANQGVRPGPSPQQPGQVNAQSNPLQTSQSQMNAAIEAAKNQQLAAANRMTGANAITSHCSTPGAAN
ncbi:hypothetical protein NKR23_g4886 [Pleurostoma richardsiae]|uniref:Uncharacterized protein n=1 Tax=Pleurostoma richardsiae TaxID=41990 RepID=A0AA38S3E0_9PEZI|nr:hypothetical protein NKR23_g4886 [Pleurostoma richardsiae]